MLMLYSGYMAPEYLYRGEISAQSDIYSLGLIIIEITTREKNCPDKDQPSARSFIDKVRGNNFWVLNSSLFYICFVYYDQTFLLYRLLKIGQRCT
jgi:serine/threonine protein kinase